MMGDFGKFDRIIIPPPDTVRITPYAVNKAVNKEEKQQYRNGKQKKNTYSYEEKITISSQESEEETAGVFDEYKDVSDWIPVKDLLANASVRLKLLTASDNPPETHVYIPVSPAYEAYRSAMEHNRVENNLTFEEKLDISDVISHQSGEERAAEISHLKELIPGLRALLDAGYTHMPLISGKGLLETAGTAVSKL